MYFPLAPPSFFLQAAFLQAAFLQAAFLQALLEVHVIVQYVFDIEHLACFRKG
ncbi:MAG: hypothetical protein ACI9CE_000220 [Flavobacterium sp.]